MRLISNWTSCTIQGEIVLVISNRSGASRSSDFEITRAITHSIVLHSVQLLLTIIIIIIIITIIIIIIKNFLTKTLLKTHRKITKVYPWAKSYQVVSINVILIVKQ